MEGEEFRIEETKPYNPDLITSIITVQEGRSYVLSLIWKGKETQKQIQGNLTVITNDQEMNEITIPYSIFSVHQSAR